MARDVLGRPLRDLRISVTDRCNFRCPYCMPAELFGERHDFLPRDRLLTFEEIEALARVFVRLGTRKLRLTGGEPLLRRDLPELVRALAAIRGVEDLSLTTNGALLAAHAAALRGAGLRRVTVSLDSIDPDVFRKMSGNRCELPQVQEGIEAAERAGFPPVKLNCVVQRGVNDGGLVDLARFARAAGRIVRFIEFMDVGNVNGWDLSQVLPASEILARIGAEMPLERVPPNYPGEVATRYRYVDGGGEIGVIASVTAPFCGACSRARLSPDGRLYTCLFAGEGFDLRGPLRDGADEARLTALVEGVWRRRTDRYSEERTERTEPPPKKVEMYRIGG